MSEQMRLSQSTIQLLLTRYPRFGSDLASITIEFNEHLKYHTAATNGKRIYLDPNYFASLDDDGRLFLLAHEIMHIKFLHHLRLERNGIRRDEDTWNEVTDAIINANLERDGFKIKQGYVNIPGALQYSAEELYDIIKEQREKNKSEAENGENSSNNGNGENENTSSNGKDMFKDDHSMWEKAFEEYKNSTNDDKEENKSKTENNETTSSQSEKEKEINENQEFNENRIERTQKAKENFERMREETLKKITENNSAAISFDNIGTENNSIDWKLLLRREVEKDETIWTQRRGILENNYAYRLEENENEEDAESEVLIDVSGSVDLNLVKSFLRIVKPILKSSKLKVGCFNTKFWGWTEIKSTQDIDHFTIPEGARGTSSDGTNLDLPVRSFTKKKEINKLIFTDGYPSAGYMPKEDLKGENVLWIVYGNKDFHPCCGKIIQISEQELNKMNTIEMDNGITR